jgi:2-C-methyl-D-erythritol 4-phosphate cytidylyltransferase/2-C-methyl-D-erythritol 2,4-cyclodiphosphate synthase
MGMDSRKIAVIIVAAGDGSRLGGDRPKAYRLLQGQPILNNNINIFNQVADIESIIIVRNPAHHEWLQPILDANPQLSVVNGGATRQESVCNALEKIENDGFTHVLIHDAARPFISVEVIQRVLDGLTEYKAVIPVIPVTDTIKQVADSIITHTPNRADLFAAQTPQGFEYKTILSLHQYYKDNAATDDAMLAEWAKIAVKVVAGSPQNIKITTPEDIMQAEKSFNPMNLRTGMGYDVHQFTSEEATGSIHLCGVEVPCDARLEGHSDGDVGLHALTDAIFGALAAGDLGQHFPSSDMQWKNADSTKFLIYAKELMEKNQAILLNADITIVANKPKVSTHRDAMRERIASILGVDVACISVKATTTDGLGFTGRGEGLAAQAIVSLYINNK